MFASKLQVARQAGGVSRATHFIRGRPPTVQRAKKGSKSNIPHSPRLLGSFFTRPQQWRPGLASLRKTPYSANVVSQITPLRQSATTGRVHAFVVGLKLPLWLPRPHSFPRPALLPPAFLACARRSTYREEGPTGVQVTLSSSLKCFCRFLFPFAYSVSGGPIKWRA